MPDYPHKYHAIPMFVHQIGLPLAIRLLFFSLTQWFRNRYTSPWTLNTDGPPQKLISLACVLAHVDSPNTTRRYIYNLSRRNWRQFVALDVSKLASSFGGSAIGHNVTLRSPQHRLNFGLLQVPLDRCSSRKIHAWHRSHFTENIPQLCTTKCQCFSWLTGLAVDVN